MKRQARSERARLPRSLFRILLLSSLLGFAPPHVPSLLSIRAGPEEKQLPWTRLVLSDLELLASFHAARLAELGSPKTNAEAWASFIISFPAQWRSLVKSMIIQDMPLDSPVEKTELPAAAARFQCPSCPARFPTEKALASHQRAKHKLRSPFLAYLPKSGVCPICRMQFSSRPRLLAHAIETRRRGRRSILCSDLLRAGLASPLPPDEQEEANQADRIQRGAAQKRGRTQPLSSQPAKRRAVSSTVPPHSYCPKVGFQYLEGEANVPPNAVRWEDIRPRKRLRSKVGLDRVALSLARAEG